MSRSQNFVVEYTWCDYVFQSYFWAVFTGHMLFILEDCLSLELFGSSWLRTVETFTFHSFSGFCFLSFMTVIMYTEHFCTIPEIPRREPYVYTAHIIFTFPNFPCLDNSFFYPQDSAQPFHHWKRFSFSQQIHANHQSMCKTLTLQSCLVIYLISAWQTSL